MGVRVPHIEVFQLDTFLWIINFGVVERYELCGGLVKLIHYYAQEGCEEEW